jgi:large subunit ribosomal protein L30
MTKKIKITQVRSVIGKLEAHKRTIKALGLRKIRSSVVHEDTPVVRGMVNSVKHLVIVEVVDGE